MIGFELLKTRSNLDKIDINGLENQYGIQLLPLYRVFIETFDIGIDKLLDHRFLSPETENLHECSTYIYGDGEVDFMDFNDPEQVFEIWKENFYPEKGYLPIGATGLNEGLFVGTKGENTDVIFSIRNDTEPRQFTKPCAHIFEFVKGLRVVSLDEKYLFGDIKYDNLYKKWDEDFWRVRELEPEKVLA